MSERRMAGDSSNCVSTILPGIRLTRAKLTIETMSSVGTDSASRRARYPCTSLPAFDDQPSLLPLERSPPSERYRSGSRLCLPEQFDDLVGDVGRPEGIAHRRLPHSDCERSGCRLH